MLGREGRMATSIGPVVADSEAIALALLAKSAASASGPFIIDVPEAHRAIRAWLEVARGDHATWLHAHDTGGGQGAGRSDATSLLLPALNSANCR